MDIGTALAIFTALGGKGLFEPSATAIGEKLRNSLGNIASKAKAKLKGNILPENVEPNYRVLNTIAREGAFCEDNLMSEYFGGVMASSLSGISRDDRAVAFASLIGRLSSYQIRAHYIFYKTVKSLFDGRTDVSIFSKNRTKLETFIPNNLLNPAMEFSEEEKPVIIIPSVMSGLARENLIEKDFEVIGGEKTTFCGGDGIVFCPTDLGVELFLWGHGEGNTSAMDFLKKECEFTFDTKIQIPAGKSVANVLESYRKRMEQLKPTF